MEFSSLDEFMEGPLIGPNPVGIILEGVLAFPGVNLNVNGSLFKGATLSASKLEWQADKNNEEKSNKNRDKIFGLYKTFNNNPDSRGIGLFITRNQVEAMGGEINVESQLNEGTTFKIYLKWKKRKYGL